MPWYNIGIPEYIKKSVCTCLIKRYLSQFIENELTRDQLNLDLYNGKATAERISLAVEALNELGETQNWPIEFVDGYISKIDISVPWKTILKDPTYVEIHGLRATVQPKQRNEDASSMFESIWNSMTSSMHLAEEFAKEEISNDKATQAIQGIEIFAQTIESIVGRIKIKLVDTVLEIDHIQKDSPKGVGLIVNIDVINYFDECGNDPTTEEVEADPTTGESKKAYLIPLFTTKILVIDGVTVSSIEFSTVLDENLQPVPASRKSSSESKEKNFFDTLNDNESCDEVDSRPSQNIILIGKFCNKQEIRIKLKESEDLTGPKVDIAINFGPFILFISPRQFHLILALIDGFASAPINESNSGTRQSYPKSKHMNDKDYEKVQQELQNLINPFSQHQAANLQQTHGWSSGPMEDSSESSFLPMKQAGASGMYDSTMSGFSSSMESSINSSVISSVTDQSNFTHRRANTIDADPTAEISRFQITIASLSVILLHEDLLSVPTDNEKVLIKQMQNTSTMFFENIDYSKFSGFMGKDFREFQDAYEKACNMNHLRLLAAPLHIKLDETTTTSLFSISGQMVAPKMELLECLYTGSVVKYIPLLTFDNPITTQESPSSINHNMRFKFRHVQKIKSATKRRGPRTELCFNFDKCLVEFDISIIDRITALINHQPIFVSQNQSNPNRTSSFNKQFNNTVPASCLDLKITSPLMKIKLRFPIPDFRPAYDLSKYPWWERNVRADYLVLSLSDAKFHTSIQSSENFSEYLLQCKLLDIHYFESESSKGYHIGKSVREDLYLNSTDPSSPVRLSIKIFPKKGYIGDESEPDPMAHSCYGAFENQGRSEPGPFGAKKVVHESDTPHSKLHRDDTEELIIPGESPEIEKFMTSTISNTHILVDLELPVVSVQLPTKHIYELIYNRINNDLLLWESAAPKPTSNFYGSDFYSPLRDDFLLAKSGAQYESESDSDDSDKTTSNIFYSTYDKMKQLQKANQEQPTHKIFNTQSSFAMNFKIGEGLLNLNSPVRDAATNNVLPGQKGEFLLNLKDANIFIVSGYRGDDGLGYVCVQLKDAQLYHCDIQTIAKTDPSLKEVGSAIGQHLFPTIYRADEKTLAGATIRGGDREMFTVAVKIQASHETHHVKNVQVSLGLNKATLRHKMCKEPNSWISQLLDFFNVTDYPIPGYLAKDVLTELHLHLWNCAVDYRPLHLPIRSLVSIGVFSLSSHLAAVANTSTLRFIFEDCGLFLSDKNPPRNGLVSNAKVDLVKDYINVMELGLFEISLKTTDKKLGINPHIDFRASNNLLYIRTCADSGSALMQLINYIANDGDFGSEKVKEESVPSSPKHVPNEEDLVSVESQQDTTLTKTQQEQVNELLNDAMEDDIKNSDDPLNVCTGAKVFYFPDEKDLVTTTDSPAKPLPQVTSDLGDLNDYQFNNSNDTDDEFCIVGGEEENSMFPKDGQPEVCCLLEEPVSALDNYLAVPIGKRDLLQPPKGYPTPVVRYTLCEMTVIWQMYGGHDFPLHESQSAKKQVRFSEKQLSDTVAFTKGQVTINNEADKNWQKKHWVQRGGLNRDHSVLMEFQLNKIRFQHEVYPDNTTQASRQVLVISDVEIRDRLETSQINKFLYQYSSQTRPKKFHSNMVLVKAVHIRPDVKLKSQECCLKVSLLPIRLNIDQDSLLFLINFFNELGGKTLDAPTPEPEKCETVSSKHNTPTHQPPIMTITDESEAEIKQQAQKAVNENLILLMEDSKIFGESESIPPKVADNVDETPVYFRKVIFSHDVLIRLDYHGKRVEMKHGPLAGLLMGLGQLNCSELRLKRIVYRHGLLGISKLVNYLIQEWLSDIKRNQLSTILGGFGPMHALLQLFQGVRDLFWLPIEQYQKDGRIVRGLQRGANSFTTSTAMAALELTSRIIYLIQITAETAYDMLSPGPSIRTRRLAKLKGRKKRYYQPQDIREGLTNACLVVREGIGETADSIVQMASLEKEQKGYSGAVGAVIRQIPSTVLKPIVIGAEATNNLLGGMQSQLVPDARKEANQKWRSDNL